MSVEAFILIGGRSSRLGRDKALVEIGGMTLAERALNVVRESGVAEKIFFVAGNETQFAVEASRLDAPFVFDIVEDRGPLGGLHAALSNATSEWILLLACDYPFITSGLLQALHSKISDDFGVVVPEQPDGRVQPLCAFYKVTEARGVVDEIIHRPRRSPPMHKIVSRLKPLVVKPDEYAAAGEAGTYFCNINTEEVLKAARKIESEA